MCVASESFPWYPARLEAAGGPAIPAGGVPCLPWVKGSAFPADRGPVVRRGRPEGTRKPAGSPPLPAGLTGPTGSIAGLGTMPVFRPGEIVRADRCRRTNFLPRGDSGDGKPCPVGCLRKDPQSLRGVPLPKETVCVALTIPAGVTDRQSTKNLCRGPCRLADAFRFRTGPRSSGCVRMR